MSMPLVIYQWPQGQTNTCNFKKPGMHRPVPRMPVLKTPITIPQHLLDNRPAVPQHLLDNYRDITQTCQSIMNRREKPRWSITVVVF